MKTAVACDTVRTGQDRWTTWRAYANLIRFHYHVSFAIVLLGVLTVTREITYSLTASLACLYVSFNILLYGGIYTINAIGDARPDGEHPRKNRRPIPAGQITISSAWIFAAVLLGCGLLSGGIFFGDEMPAVYLGFVGANLFYTFVAKKIPYVEIAFNSVTYPLRYFMGALVAGGSVSVFLLSLVFLVAVSACALRRRVEATGRYSSAALLSLETLPLAAMALLRIFDRSSHNVFYICAAGTHVVLIFGPKVFKSFRRGFLVFWTK